MLRVLLVSLLITSHYHCNVWFACLWMLRSRLYYHVCALFPWFITANYQWTIMSKRPTLPISPACDRACTPRESHPHQRTGSSVAPAPPFAPCSRLAAGNRRPLPAFCPTHAAAASRNTRGPGQPRTAPPKPLQRWTLAEFLRSGISCWSPAWRAQQPNRSGSGTPPRERRPPRRS